MNDDTCMCGHVRDEHGGDPEYPGSTSCSIEDCHCLAFDLNDEEPSDDTWLRGSYGFMKTMIGLKAGAHIPASDIMELLTVAADNGLPSDTGFLIACTVGHRIKDHNDTLEKAVQFAADIHVPDAKVRMATIADIINNCDLNRELVIKLLESGGHLDDEIVSEMMEMARVAGLPTTLSSPQIIVGLHMIKMHADDMNIKDVLEFLTKDTDFARLAKEHRPN